MSGHHPLSFTVEGLRDFLHRVDRRVTDLERGGRWDYDVETPSGGGSALQQHGTATIPDTAASAVVAHNVGVTPLAILATPRNSLEQIAITARNTTQFTATRAGTTGALEFDWVTLGEQVAAAYLVSDSFNRANGVLGSTDGAGTLDPVAWTTFSGSDWAVSGNRATRTSGSGFAVAGVQTAASDVLVQLTFISQSGGGNCGIAFRIVDQSNFWTCFYDSTSNNMYLSRVAGGTFTHRLTIATTKNSGDVLRVEAVGDQIAMFRNDVQMGSTVTDSAHQTATNHGLYMNGVVGELDDFYVEAL